MFFSRIRGFAGENVQKLPRSAIRKRMCSNVLWLGPVSRRLPRDAIRQNLNRQVEKPYLGAVR
jgi:hypothetical protein